MRYSFQIKGHENILATHPTTLEFTKDKELTEKGDCVIGVSSIFDSKKLKEFLKCNKIRITITADKIKETIIAKPDANFNDDREIVIRIGAYQSSRTFANDADKASKHLSRELIYYLQNPQNKAIVEVECES
ncbi:MAG TPA: DUF371 domain-containing protein [Candidatus Nanoarchaeia archaeon]|nr:DUF371 domain-containing protein [Candidatus Nanoarchaeia archaeon]